MPNWQNLKIFITHWLSHSPTWIQEMLAHLKIYHKYFLPPTILPLYSILLQFLPNQKHGFSEGFLWFICWHMIATGCRASLCLLTRCGRRWHRFCCWVLDTICDPSPHSNIFTAPFFFRGANEWLLDISKSDLVDAKEPRVNQTAGEKVVVTTFSFFKAELSKALSPILDVGWSYF